ncbi:uncharacterized protein [Coffea arabica]|uniref:Uncharacterized protein n=1 Tax=Coffea arabica TaxID=13443 RepID=A0ABM4VQG6_COFAR
MIQEKRKDDFIKLKQMLLSVVEYEEWFTKLFKFALDLVVTERKRKRKFIQELNIEIQESLATTKITIFTDALDKAQRIENAKSQSKTFHARKRSNPSNTPELSEKSTQPLKMERGAGGVRMPGKSGRAPSREPRQKEIIVGEPNHTEAECWRKQGKCLLCGNAEHQISSCPNAHREGGNTQQPARSVSKQSSAGGSQPKVPARLYALNNQQIPNPTEVVEVKTPTGNQCLIANKVYRNCEIWVGERKLLADLMSLAIKGYDVILEMDWLDRYHAQLDCKMKLVELRIPGEATLKLDVMDRLVSSTLISGIRVRKLLSSGGKGYLDFLINALRDKVKLENVPVVKEFFDVFLEELETFPLEREIALKIDVAPRTAPISKTPYRMAVRTLRSIDIHIYMYVHVKCAF